MERGQFFDKNIIFKERATVSTTLGLECVRVFNNTRVAPHSFIIFTLSSVPFWCNGLLRIIGTIIIKSQTYCMQSFPK